LTDAGGLGTSEGAVIFAEGAVGSGWVELSLAKGVFSV
jgi:hypothetical protein